MKDVTDKFLRLQEELAYLELKNSSSFSNELKSMYSYYEKMFFNKDNLDFTLKIGGLAYEYAFLQSADRFISEKLEILLSEFRRALKSEYQKTIDFVSHSWIDISRVYRDVISTAYLEIDSSNLDEDSIVKNYFRIIGDLVENCISPLAKIREKIRELAGCNDCHGVDAVESKGKLFLRLSLIDKTLYSPPPYNIPLSQWRNISIHRDYDVTSGIIICRYGKNKQNNISITLEDLIRFTEVVHQIYYIHKTAFEIFSIDNIQFIKGLTSGEGLSSVNSTTMHSSLVLGLVASGFRIQKAGHKNDRWALLLTDLHNRDNAEIDTMLKSAVTPFVIQHDTAHFVALVLSRDVVSHFSFEGKIQKR